MRNIQTATDPRIVGTKVDWYAKTRYKELAMANQPQKHNVHMCAEREQLNAGASQVKARALAIPDAAHTNLKAVNAANLNQDGKGLNSEVNIRLAADHPKWESAWTNPWGPDSLDSSEAGSRTGPDIIEVIELAEVIYNAGHMTPPGDASPPAEIKVTTV
jgi:hypothetical protein